MSLKSIQDFSITITVPIETAEGASFRPVLTLLCALTNLQRIDIFMHDDAFFRLNHHIIKDFICRSADTLHSLSIVLGSSGNSSVEWTTDHLIHDSTSKIWRLQHLEVPGIRLMSTPLSLQLYRSLTSVDVRGSGSYPPAFWRSLKQEGVQLHALFLETLSEEILHYLASYSGLQKLSIVLGDSPFPSELLSTELFHDALFFHSGTLQRIRMHMFGANSWCFNERWGEFIHRCERLIDLGLVFGGTASSADVVKSLVCGASELVTLFN
jgi:hypothetical protein